MEHEVFHEDEYYVEEARPRYEVARRYTREDVVKRMRRSLRGAVAALRRWERYYEKRLRETRAPFFRERLERVRERLDTLLRFREALERAGYDLFKLATSEIWISIIRGDNRVYVPDDLPEAVRKMYKEAVAVVLEHHTRFGTHRTGWDGLVDCDGFVIEALRDTRPSDRVTFYAYVRFSEVIEYRHGRRVKATDTLTISFMRARLSDVDVQEVFAAAYKAARDEAAYHLAEIEEVCVVVKPAF